MAKLVVLTEGLKGRSYDLITVLTTIGRVEDNAFQLAEPSVSSHHCEILLRGNDVVVKDLNSTNGTFINGQPVTETVLKPGQVLRLGQVELRLDGDGAPPPPAAQRTEQTMILPQSAKRGVKMDQLESSKTGTFTKDSPFSKKSNKGTKIFIIAAAVVGVAIVIAIIFAFTRISSQ
jgi:pSer/pThr/pTyr-binding forkhead associated (FHA) protein